MAYCIIAIVICRIGDYTECYWLDYLWQSRACYLLYDWRIEKCFSSFHMIRYQATFTQYFKQILVVIYRDDNYNRI